MEDFTHINAQGRARMVDVSDKDITARTAKAYGVVYMNAETIEKMCIRDRYDVLKERKIMGAALDVFENEPLEKDSKLWKLDNLLISPHICSGSNYMNKRVYDLVYENLKAFINKEELKNRII